jgi:hypothetical protein
MPQQRVNARFAPTESLERFERGSRATHRKDFAMKAQTDFRQQVAVGCRLFERAVRIGRKNLSPLVAIVARRVTASKEMAERVLEAVEWRRREDSEAFPHAGQYVLHGPRAARVEIEMQVHVE